MKHAVLSQLELFHSSYAQSLASTRILKHSEQSSRGSCGENLAWASYDQSGAAFVFLSICRNLSFTEQREWCWAEAKDPVCGVGTGTAGIHYPCISPVIPLYFRVRCHDSLHRYVRLMRCLSGIKSGYKCNSCEQLVDCLYHWFHHTHSALWTRGHHDDLPSSMSPVCVQGRTCLTAGMTRSNSTTSTVLDSPLAQVRFSSNHLDGIT